VDKSLLEQKNRTISLTDVRPPARKEVDMGEMDKTVDTRN